MNFSYIKRIFSKEKNAEATPSEPPMQFVLNYSTGKEQTSLVSKEKIRQAINDISKHEDVWLNNCRPVATPWGNCSGLSCTKTPARSLQVAVYFTLENGLRRYVSLDYSKDTIIEMFCNYFEHLEIPKIGQWETSDFFPEPPEAEPYYLYVDGEEFKHIDYDDVLAAIDNLEAGKCSAFMLKTPSWQNGYLEVRGKKDDYIVEFAGDDEEGNTKTFSTDINYGRRVRYWLYNYYHKREFPRLTDDWHNITDEVTTEDE